MVILSNMHTSLAGLTAYCGDAREQNWLFKPVVLI